MAAAERGGSGSELTRPPRPARLGVRGKGKGRLPLPLSFWPGPVRLGNPARRAGGVSPLLPQQGAHAPRSPETRTRLILSPSAVYKGSGSTATAALRPA